MGKHTKYTELAQLTDAASAIASACHLPSEYLLREFGRSVELLATAAANAIEDAERGAAVTAAAEQLAAELRRAASELAAGPRDGGDRPRRRARSMAAAAAAAARNPDARFGGGA
ncbi:hypothetical protein AB0A73_22065 [Glycomyces sp. NPDC047369]